MDQAHRLVFRRKRFILSLIEGCGREIDTIKFHNILFLAQQNIGIEHYQFIPHKDGCYSFRADADLSKLAKEGWLKINRGQIRLPSKESKWHDLATVSSIESFYKGIEHSLDYSKKAQIEMSRNEKEESSSSGHLEILYTIGYEGISVETYLNKLIENGVELLCDVRKNPHSRKFGFSKKSLGKMLQMINVKYMHIPELGISSSRRTKLDSYESYTSLFEQYVAELPTRKESIQKIVSEFSNAKRIALTCFESQPTQCHRHCLIDHLHSENNNLKVCHL